MSNDAEPDHLLKTEMRAAFEAGLPHRVARASRVKLQSAIPAHWFAAAASECASMYIAGFFYGAISVAQAYVEALSLFLTEIHHLRKSSDTAHRWTRLREKQVSSAVYEAAIAILTDRNHFHHLNKLVEQDFEKVVSPEVV